MPYKGKLGFGFYLHTVPGYDSSGNSFPLKMDGGGAGRASGKDSGNFLLQTVNCPPLFSPWVPLPAALVFGHFPAGVDPCSWNKVRPGTGAGLAILPPPSVLWVDDEQAFLGFAVMVPGAVLMCAWV